MSSTRTDTAPRVADAARVAAALTLLRRAAADHAPAALASSFGAEDMVLIDLIAKNALPIAVFTLDTGRLPEETHALIDRVRSVYRIGVDVRFPDATAVERFVSTNGVNAFYESTALREQCCAIRKTQPLARALAGKGAWITGLRREQSVTRREVAVEEFDIAHGVAKFNPLADWTRDDVWDVPARASRAVQRAARSRLRQHRLRTPTPRDRARRGRTRGPLVVGKRRPQECGLHRARFPFLSFRLP